MAAKKTKGTNIRFDEELLYQINKKREEEAGRLSIGMYIKDILWRYLNGKLYTGEAVSEQIRQFVIGLQKMPPHLSADLGIHEIQMKGKKDQKAE